MATAFTLHALLDLNDAKFKEGLEGAEKKTKGFGDKLGKLGKGISNVGKVAGAAVAAASVAIGKLVLDSVNVYSNYEQLVGGVETLFGTGGQSLEEYQKKIGITEKSTQKQIDQSIDKYNSLQKAQDLVMKNAHKAFQTAGVDANTYMETVTGFSASLLQSVGGDTLKAAKIADMAMTDMSDNANKMGTDMSAIQNAYAGFAKQNYTMLDNLKLGYGGTASEMKRLLKDAEEIQRKNGVNVKYSINNLSDVYEAIHVVQEEMGVAGTTAKEASTTIQGSTNMMKAAWTNLKIAIVDPEGNVGQAISDLTESVKTAAKNWFPAIKEGLIGIGKAVAELAPVISAELPQLISDLLPSIVTAGVSLVTAIVKSIVDNIDKFIDAASQILDAIINVFKESDSPVLQFMGEALEGIKDVISFIIELFTDFPSAVRKLKESDSPVLQTLGKALETIKGVVESIIDFFSNFDQNVKALQKSDNPVLQTLGKALETIKGVIDAIIEAFTSGIDSAINTLKQSDNPVLSTLGKGLETLKGVIEFIIEAFETDIDSAINTLKQSDNPVLKVLGESLEKIKKVITAIIDFFDNFDQNVRNLQQSDNPVLQVLGDALDTIKGVIKFIIDAFNSGIGNAIKNLKQSDNPILQTLGHALDIIKDVIEFIIAAFTKDIGSAIATLQQSDNPVLQVLGNALKGLKDIIDAISSAIETAIGWIKDLIGYDGTSVSIKQTVTKETVNKTRYETEGQPPGSVGSTETVYADGSNTQEFDNGGVSGGIGFARGAWDIPYDMPAQLHRGEMVLTASQARQYRDGNNGDIDYASLTNAIVSAIREGMNGAEVHSHIDGKEITDIVNRNLGKEMLTRRFA